MTYVEGRQEHNDGAIGRVFGVFYSAICRLVKGLKERMKKDKKFGRKVKAINSPFKL